MDNVKSRTLLVLITISLIVSILASSGAIGVEQASGPTYTTHSAIRINSNADLASLRSSGGCTGSGTVNDPYVIKNYDITGSGGICIYIGNTTKYLVIRDCYLHDNSIGIKLFASSNVTVSNNDCSGNSVYGIHMVVSSRNVIEKNTFIGKNSHAMFLQDSDSNSIENNTCLGSVHCSIWLSSSNSNLLSNNTSSGSGGNGIQLQSSGHCILSNNTFNGNSMSGIRVFDSSNYNTIIHNLCQDNIFNGISMTSSNSNSIGYNVISGNTQHGMILYSSSNNGIYGNELIDNNGATSSYDRSHVQAYDNGTEHWNSSSYGNFWSDWVTPDANNDGIVDNPYLIDGGTGAKDHLPATSCPGLHFELGGPSQALNGDDISWSFLVRNDGEMTILNAIVTDPMLHRTWMLGDVAPGGSQQWSYPGVIPSYENVTNIAYATGTDANGGRYNVSDPHTIQVLRPPSSPQGLIVSPTDGGATLLWAAPSSTGGAPITDYNIFRSTSSGVEAYLGHTGSGSTLTFTDSGLTNGQTYYYQVSAVNSAGEGLRCSESTASPLGLPTAPQDLQATPGNGQVVLTWSAPSSDGGATVDLYIVYQDGADVLHVTSTSATITGLTNGQQYSLIVAAHNSVGIGPQSTAATATPIPPNTVPGVPTDLSTTPGDGQIELSWSAPGSNGGATVDYYLVYVDGVARSEHYATSSATITELTNGQSYVLTVAAHNSVGTGTQSASVNSMPSPTPTVPDVPTSLTGMPGDGQIELSWSAPGSNGGATVDYYLVYINDIERSEHYATTSATFTGLTNGQSYSFTVAAHNSVGIGPRSSALTAAPSPAPTAPGAPTGLIATPGNSQVSLSWTAPSSDGGATIEYYLVYINDIERSDHYTTVSPTITGLTNGQQYNFTVAAHNSVGIGLTSSAVTATPSPAPTVPGAPTGLIATPGNGQVSLSWTAPTNNGGVSIDYYIVYQGGIDISHPVATSNMITGLTNDRPYNFTVAAHNSVGIGAQTSVVMASPSSSPAVPGTPTGLNTTLGDGLVTLSWTAPQGSSGIDYYVVYQNGVDVSHPSGTSTTITGLTNGQNYSFAVAAHNSDGVGARSSPLNVSPGVASSNGATSSPGNDSMVYFLGVLALLAAIIALVLVVRRKKKGL